MSNIPSWLSKWARSPRQDRRVIEDGKFVELGKVHVSEPPLVPEQEQSALEIVQENVPAQERISGTVFEEARYEQNDAEATGAGENVLPDSPTGSSETGLQSSDVSNDANPPASVGTTEEVPNSAVSTAEEQSPSDIALHGFKESPDAGAVTEEPAEFTLDADQAIAEYVAEARLDQEDDVDKAFKFLSKDDMPF